MSAVRLALAVSLALTVSSCATATLPCGSSLACGDGRICGLDGRCDALPAEPRAPRAEHQAPREWAVTGAGLPRELGTGGDGARIGGGDGGALWLAFDPAGADVSRALVVLRPRDPASRRTREAVVVAARVADGVEIARARLLPGAARPIVLDVTGQVERALEITVRATAPLDVATPRHLDPRARPRLELTRAGP